VCYVNWVNGPLAVQNGVKIAYQPSRHNTLIRAKNVRIGATGDPGAIPASVSVNLTRLARGWTGYHHSGDPDLDSICMVSTQDEESEQAARDEGKRQYRMVRHDEKPPKDMVECPNATHGVQCNDCLLCCGGDGVSVWHWQI
jgi:hypothetical protein